MNNADRKRLFDALEVIFGVLDSEADPIERYRLLHEEVIAFRQQFLERLSTQTDQARSGTFSLEQIVDLAFLNREIESLLDDWRKDVKARKELYGKIVGAALIKRAAADATDAEDLVRATLCRGKVDIKVRPKLPPKGSDEYMELCRHFGLPEDLMTEGAIRFSWKEMGEYCTRLAQEGKPMPDGISETYTDVVLTTTRHSKKAKDSDNG